MIGLAREAPSHLTAALFPAFNPEFCELNEDNSFCVVGRDENGDIVATQAGRLFDWRSSSFAEAAGNLTLLYDDPEKSALPGEAWTVEGALKQHHPPGLCGHQMFVTRQT